MDSQFVARYAPRGREFLLMGLAADNLDSDQLHAVLGFLLERAGEQAELELKQAAPLGAPNADPPQNNGLIEG